MSRCISRTRYRCPCAQSHRCCVAYGLRVCEDARVSVDERVAVLGEGLLATMNVESAMLLIADCDVNLNLLNEPLCSSAMVATTKFYGTALSAPSADLFFEEAALEYDGYA